MHKKQPRNLRLENLENRWVYAAGLGCDGHHEDPLLDQDEALVAEGEGPTGSDSLPTRVAQNQLKVSTDLRDGELVLQVEVVRPRPGGTSLRGEGEFAPNNRPEMNQPQVRLELSNIRIGQSNQTNPSRANTDVTKVSVIGNNVGNLNTVGGSGPGAASFLAGNPLDSINPPGHPVEPFRFTVASPGAIDASPSLRPAPPQTQPGVLSFRDEVFFRSVQNGLTQGNNGRSNSSLSARLWGNSGSASASELVTNSADTMSVRATEVIFGNQQSRADLQSLDALLNDLAREHRKNQGDGRVEAVQAGQGGPATVSYNSVDPIVTEGGMIALSMERGDAITTLLADNSDEEGENRIWVTNVGVYREIDFLSPGNSDASLVASQQKDALLKERSSDNEDTVKRVNPLVASGTALVSLLYFGMRRNRNRSKLNAARQSALNA